MWYNSSPLQDIRLRNLSDVELDLSRSLKVKCDDVLGLAIHGFLLTYSNHLSNSHHLVLIATQNVFFYLLPLGPNYEKSQVHQMTLNAKRPYVPVICWAIVNKTQISLRFALPLLLFQIIEVFDFSIEYNGKCAIVEKKSLKHQELKMSKIPM